MQQPDIINAGDAVKCLHTFSRLSSAPALNEHVLSARQTNLEKTLKAESVIIRRTSINGEKRGIVCLSSQAGCAMGCTFCATAQMGLVANLDADEIISQAINARNYLADRQERLSNAVFMGMGEPLHNLDAVLESSRWLTSPKGGSLALRRVCISTIGLIPALESMIGKTKVSLAWSLHAPNDSLRQQLVPVAKKYSIAETKKVLIEYLRSCGNKHHIMVAYTLIKGVNDSPDMLEEMMNNLNGLNYQLNVIPYNSSTGLEWQEPSALVCDIFVQRARDLGIRTTLRHSNGRSAHAACGQLALRKL